ncbi:hypothetical protein F5Y09DRAFT_338767 [Xylaria sp. FL1042]|nr:hypothetical protein F5Y09DRAFT_338767 [Xylaria sp. FL1042]
MELNNFALLSYVPTIGEPRETARNFVEQLLESHKTTSSSRSYAHFDNLAVGGVQAAPTVWTTIQSWANVFNPRSYHKVEPERTLLHGFSGSLLGGEMLLVIGSPGSGCTTLLKALTNMRDEYKGMSGKVTYGGRPAHHRDPDGVRLTFCAEEDSHLPTLTVAQTLRFAIRVTWDAKGPGATIDAAVFS